MKLKKCPFCGNDASIECVIEPHTHFIAKTMPDVEGFTAFISCDGYECTAAIAGPEEKTRKEAIEKVSEMWNKRS